MASENGQPRKKEDMTRLRIRTSEALIDKGRDFYI